MTDRERVERLRDTVRRAVATFAALKLVFDNEGDTHLSGALALAMEHSETALRDTEGEGGDA